MQRTSLRWLGLLGFAGLLSACDRNTTSLEIFPEFDDVYSFESGMEGWDSRAIDLGVPPADFEVARTNERADDGTFSVRLRLDNVGESKVWIERRYQVAANQEYQITMGFALASADHGGIAPWLVMAGASPERPAVAADLTASQDTGNGSATDAGHRWGDRTRVVLTASDGDGELFVYLGVWGRSPGSRRYSVDDVRLTFLRQGISSNPNP